MESGSEELIDLAEGVLGTNVLSVKTLAKLSLKDIFTNPSQLEPPILSLGEFHAELNEQEVRDAFSACEFEFECIKVEKLEELMVSLNADFDEEEMADAKAGLDPTQCGVVSNETFRKWWMSDDDGGGDEVIEKVASKTNVERGGGFRFNDDESSDEGF